MKAMFSEEYYREFWERFLVPVPGEDYINLEGELEKAMAQYKGAWVTDAVREVLERVEAQKIADRCRELVMKELDTVKRLEAGTASLGYTSRRQEINARGDYRKRFEFNCLQFADFKKKYNLNK